MCLYQESKVKLESNSLCVFTYLAIKVILILLTMDAEVFAVVHLTAYLKTGISNNLLCLTIELKLIKEKVHPFTHACSEQNPDNW